MTGQIKLITYMIDALDLIGQAFEIDLVYVLPFPAVFFDDITIVGPGSLAPAYQNR